MRRRKSRATNLKPVSKRKCICKKHKPAMKKYATVLKKKPAKTKRVVNCKPTKKNRSTTYAKVKRSIKKLLLPSGISKKGKK